MNTLGIALAWCVVQVTLIGLLAAGLYLMVRWLRPAAAASVVCTCLAVVVILSLLVLSPWPRWTIGSVAQSGDQSAQALPDATSDISPETISSQVRRVGQAVMDELARPQTTGPTTAWQWPSVLAVLLLAAMACGLGWLMLGVAAVRWQRMRSRPVLDRELLELVDVLRTELGCCRPVEIRQSDDLATAATIGWRRPVLLLPGDWTTWTVEQRRAVLAHEIVHARSHDFIALLVGQLGLSLHVYHPLLHWLIGRLRLEQELAADAAAASVSGGQRQYLTTIAELALRQQDRPLLWPARTFLPTRTTFLRRIAMLRDSKLRFDRLSPVARLLTVVAVLLCGLLVAGLRGPGGSGPALADEPKQSDAKTMPSDLPTAAAHAQREPQNPSTKQGMMALVEDFFHHNFRDVTSRETIEWGEVTKTADGNSSIRYKYRAKIWDKETKIINQVFTFDKQGKFVAVNDVMADPGSKEGMIERVEDFFHHNYRDVTSRETIEWGDVAKTKDGNYSIRYKYRARYWYGEPKIVSQIFTFNPKGQFVSVDYAEKHAPTPARVYEVHKKVADFPNGEDLTTPEAAYASIHRAWAAEGDAAWPRLSVPTLAAHMPGGDKRPLPTDAADRLLGAEVLEVHVWDGTHAVVLAREMESRGGSYIDMRWLTRVDGRWLNEGNDGRRTIDEARQKIEQSRSH